MPKQHPVIVWKTPIVKIETMENSTHFVNSIYVDSFRNIVRVAIQKGTEVNIVFFTMEEAQKIGFINLQALNKYCKT